MTETAASTAAKVHPVLPEARRAFLAVGVFSLFINLLMLTAPIYMLQVYERVLTSRSVDTLVMLTILAVVLLAMNAIVEAARSRVLVRVCSRFDAAASGILFDGVIVQKVAGGDDKGVRPLRDLDTVRGFLTGPGLLAFFDAPWIPIYLGLIFLFHPLLGAIATGGAVILFLIAVSVELVTRKAVARAGEANDEAHALIETTTRNAEVVHALGMTGGLRKQWYDRYASGLVWRAKATDRSGLLTSFAKFIRPTLQIAILGTGAYLAVQQSVSAGVMIAASIIMGRALAPVEAAIASWRQFVAARNARARLNRMLDETTGVTSGMTLPRPRGDIELEALYVAPPGSRTAVLRGISLQVAAGEVIGVIGPSAAGKSTLARALVGVWPPLNGAVRLDGMDVSRWRRAELGPYIGYMPQDVELFSGTVAENIARFGEADAEATIAAATAAGAHRMILQLPDGYDTEIGDAGQALSGGQRQRVALARALFGRPSLIVMDEPNASLDVAGEQALIKAIEEIRGWCSTVVVVAQRPTILAGADKLMVMREGQVESFGPAKEIMAKLSQAAGGIVRPSRPSVAREEMSETHA